MFMYADCLTDHYHLPYPSSLALTKELKSVAYYDFDFLLRLGGRPSAPIDPDPSVWGPSVTDQYLHVPFY